MLTRLTPLTILTRRPTTNPLLPSPIQIIRIQQIHLLFFAFRSQHVGGEFGDHFGLAAGGGAGFEVVFVGVGAISVFFLIVGSGVQSRFPQRNIFKVKAIHDSIDVPGFGRLTCLEFACFDGDWAPVTVYKHLDVDFLKVCFVLGHTIDSFIHLFLNLNRGTWFKKWLSFSFLPLPVQ